MPKALARDCVLTLAHDCVLALAQDRAGTRAPQLCFWEHPTWPTHVPPVTQHTPPPAGFKPYI